MPVTVSINALTAVHQGSNGISMAMPDVCNTPSPAGPIPIPYPNIAQSAQAMGTATDVQGDGSPLCHKDSYFMPSSGDEAGSAGGIMSGTIKGKAEFINFSFNVQIGGKPAVRALDPMLHNNKNTPPFPLMQPPLPALPKPPGEAKCVICDRTIESSAPPAENKSAQQKPTSGDLAVEFATAGGLAVADDEGFDLVHEDGTVETAKLNGGRFKKSGAKPGRYQLRAKTLRAARWTVDSAHPYDDLSFEVETNNFPDGTSVTVKIVSESDVKGAAPLATLSLSLDGPTLTGHWKYEQKPGDPSRVSVRLEATIGKKVAASAPLVIEAHDLDGTRGLQERLRALGYDPGPASDAVNDAISGAVEKFQQDHPPLVVDRIAGALTLGVLETLGV